MPSQAGVTISCYVFLFGFMTMVAGIVFFIAGDYFKWPAWRGVLTFLIGLAFMAAAHYFGHL